jgi:predicted DNA-binding protein
MKKEIATKQEKIPQIHIRLKDEEFNRLRILSKRKGLTVNMQAKSIIVEALLGGE